MTYFPHQDREEVHLPAFDPARSVLEDDPAYSMTPEDGEEYFVTDEEQARQQEARELRKLQRRNRLRMASGFGNFLSVIAGLAAALVLILLLASLITWLQSDLDHSFSLILKRL